MHPDALQVTAAAALERLPVGAAVPVGAFPGDAPGRGERGPRRSVGLLVVVELDDLGGRKVPGRLRRESLGQDRTDGEVRRHDDVRVAPLLLQQLPDLLEVLR